MNMLFLNQSKQVLLLLFFLSLLNVVSAQKPKWLKSKYRDKVFAKELYLTGYIYDNKKSNEGIADAIERVKIMARGELAQSLISEIQSNNTLKTTENKAGFDQSFEMNILSEAKAEIYNMTVEGYYSKTDNMVHGFAYAKRDEVVQYYQTNIDKYMQEIISHINIGNDLIQSGDIENAEQEFEKTKPFFMKIAFASDFIVLIKSTPIDISITEEIRKLKYSVDDKLEEIQKLKTKRLFVLEYNYEKYQVLPEDLNGTYNWQKAMNTCKDLEAFEFSDWVVPSKNILNEMYMRRAEIKNFKSSGAYWSSDENGESGWGRQFSPNGVAGYGNKQGAARVRCVRKMK